MREIAKVLASLEPGATQSSKLMLAMRFEDALFNNATTLADYRKKLAKRLKKLKKNYKATANSPALKITTEAKQNEEKLLSLKRTYGDALKFIVQHAPMAIAALREKHGAERASHLQQHTDNAKQWAEDMGLIKEGSGSATGPGKATMASSSTTSTSTSTPQLSKETLERLESHLSQRVENIRSHVVKLTQPDLFLQETLDKLQKDAKPEATDILARTMQHRLKSLHWKELYENPPKTLQDSLEKALKTVPPPTRERKSQRNTALVHLDTMRAASQALLAFLSVSDADQQRVQLPTKRDDVMVRCHQSAVNGIDYLQEAVPALTADENENDKTPHAPSSSSSSSSSGAPTSSTTNNNNNDNSEDKAKPKPKPKKVKLEDVWTKPIEMPRPNGTSVHDTDRDGTELSTHVAKRQKTTDSSTSKNDRNQKVRGIVLQSRVLLSPGRTCPSNVRAALRRKAATLIRCAQTNHSHIVLDFDDAFRVSVYLSPLVVRIQAKPKADTNWNMEVLEEVANERLDYAEAQCTRVLRTCFAEQLSKAARISSVPMSDFEVEISEATALLQFVQLLRATYMPYWEDVEVL